MKELVCVLFLPLFLNGCSNEEAPSISESRIIGEWQLVSYRNELESFFDAEDESGVIGDWGDVWVSTLKINADKTVSINFSPDHPQKNGTWKLNDDSTIRIDLSLNVYGIMRSYTFTFDKLFNDQGQMVFRTENVELKHNKIR